MSWRGANYSLLAALGGLCLALSACAAGVGQQTTDAATCNENSDCPQGFVCASGHCISEGDGGVADDGSEQSPVISVSPQTLTFSEAVVGTPETQSVTITNLGQGTLSITGINLSENDTTSEFTFSGPASNSVAPGDSVTVDVTLAPTDAELDQGQLTIESNDPASPVTSVELLSSFIGSPDLTVCVETGQAPPQSCEDPAVVNLGQVSYAASVQQTFYVRNDGDGNKIISVDDVVVQSINPSHSALFSIDLYRMEESPQGSGNWQETPVTLPYTLVSSSGGDPDPDALFGRITFTANTDGFLILSGDSLQITTTDTDNPQPALTTIPITATIDGCPPGLFDMNSDPSDGCEYGCTVTNGGVEACDGQDNDCDGTTDDFTESCYDGGDGGCNPDGSSCQGICQPGTRTCTSGTWSPCQGQVTGEPEQCDSLDNDCDGVVNNGLDEGGNSCTAPIAVSTLPDTSCNTQTLAGTITPGDSDWYDVTFSSGSNSTTFHARLEFVSPPGGGNFRMELMQSSCSAFTGCETGSNTGVTVMDWDIDSSTLGKCPGNQTCTHTIQLRVRVYSVGSSQCEEYTIQASNGC